MPGSIPIEKMVFTSDKDAARIIRAYEIDYADFFEGRSIQAGEALYFFKNGAPVEVEKIFNFMNLNGLATRQLPALGNQEFLYLFSLACINKMTIILTGGCRKDKKET